jgi:hypothetical protein
MLALLDNIFNTVFIHRSKDFNDFLRLRTIAHLPAFVTVCYSVETPLREENLKYLGFALYDNNAAVRAEAVSIYQRFVDARFFCLMYYNDCKNNTKFYRDI